MTTKKILRLVADVQHKLFQDASLNVGGRYEEADSAWQLGYLAGILAMANAITAGLPEDKKDA